MGPVYGDRIRKLDSGIAVPEAYWRIWLKQTTAGPQLLALLIPQDVCGDEAPAEFLESVDRIEALTGLDLFSALDDQLEARLEAGIQPQHWPLAQLARLEARYGGRFGPC